MAKDIYMEVGPDSMGTFLLGDHDISGQVRSVMVIIEPGMPIKVQLELNGTTIIDAKDAEVMVVQEVA